MINKQLARSERIALHISTFRDLAHLFTLTNLNSMVWKSMEWKLHEQGTEEESLTPFETSNAIIFT